MKNQAEQIRQLARMFVQVQKWRNRYGNFKQSKMPYLKDKKRWEKLFTAREKVDLKVEEELKKELLVLVKAHEWGEYLLGIKGVGEGIAGAIIGELCGDIYSKIPKGEKKKDKKWPKPKLIGHGPRVFEKTCDLWAYAGYSVRDGKAHKRKRGEAYPHNWYLKLACYKFVVNQVQQGDKYRKLYDGRKAYEKKKSPDLTKGHIESRTRRYVIKKFLSDIKHDLIK